MIEEYLEPNNVLKDIQCPNCPAWFTSTVDFEFHKTYARCKTRREEMVGWKKSRNNYRIESVHKDNVPNILVALQNGHSEFNGYKYWIFGNFVCRKRIGDD